MFLLSLDAIAFVLKALWRGKKGVGNIYFIQLILH